MWSVKLMARYVIRGYDALLYVSIVLVQSNIRFDKEILIILIFNIHFRNINYTYEKWDCEDVCIT